MKFKFDTIFRKYIISLGVDFGVNKFRHKKITNFFIEISILFWTFGFEICW